MLIDALSRIHSIRCETRGMRSLWGRGLIAGEEVILIKPQTLMNLSGEAVLEFSAAFPGFTPDSLMVAFDDCDLPAGRLRIRKGGSSGGHNGIGSIIRCLGTADFPRIRLGIGRPEGAGLVGYVLTPFTGDERHTVDEMLGRAAASVEAIIKDGIEAAMNRFNPAP